MKKSIVVFGVLCLLSVDTNIKGQDFECVTSKIKFESNEVQSLLIGTDQVKSTKPNYVEAQIKLNYPDFNYDINSYASRDDLIEAGKEYHSKKNNILFKTLGLDKYEDVFIDNYAPLICFAEKWKGINIYNDLAKNHCVSEIVLGIGKEPSPKFNYATNAIGVKPYIDNGTYDGSGVIVGILETGIVDKDHSNFDNTDLVIRDELLVNERKSTHATMVASIIGGKNGIAPGAKLLSAQLNSRQASAINWFLDNKANVVNMSYGELDPTGIYSADAAYLDYITIHYSLIFVAAAGNNNGNVCNPGLAYNTICVGASNTNDFLATDFSSYEVITGPEKPNILAPGDLMSIPGIQGSFEGTSISTAIVTGCIALLYERAPALTVYPDRLLGVLYANSEVSQSDFQSGVLEYCGAGRINFAKCLQNWTNYFHKCINFTYTYNYDYHINLTQGDELTATFTWLVSSTGAVNSVQFTNYDLYLRDLETNEVLTSSASTNNNVEIIRYVIPKTGQYSIDIRQVGSQVRSDLVSLYYRID